MERCLHCPPPMPSAKGPGLPVVLRLMWGLWGGSPWSVDSSWTSLWILRRDHAICLFLFDYLCLSSALHLCKVAFLSAPPLQVSV